MICLTCHVITPGPVCDECAAGIRPTPERVLPGGLRVVAPFEHVGTARRLMHLMKYRGVTGYAALVAELLSDRLPPAPLVPVPRSLSRRLRYGVDPSLVIAQALSARSGAPVLRCLWPPLHTRRRAGGDHFRQPGRFRVRRPPGVGVILLDDVVTTGATLLAAERALGSENVLCAAAANSVAGVSSLSGLVQTEGRD
ncbi:MAG: hypothetical protein WAL25_10530 [Acidimicrobiia bacterium]